jgi:drug/metabolite transporter (DMT)-like permease
MIIAMAGFSIVDFSIKNLSDRLPVSQILILIGFFQFGLFWAISTYKNSVFFSKKIKNKFFIIRTLADLFAAILFFIAIAKTPLSSASAIIQLNPLMVSIFALLLLGEQVKLQSWLAILVGLIGMLLIIRPGTDSFLPESIFAVLAVAMFALRDISTRLMSDDISTLTVSIWGTIGCMIAGLVSLPFFSVPLLPTNYELLLIFLVSPIGCIAYFSLVSATQRGNVSIISPFRYTRLLFTLILSFYFLNERPDFIMLLGILMITCAGIYHILNLAQK